MSRNAQRKTNPINTRAEAQTQARAVRVPVRADSADPGAEAARFPRSDGRWRPEVRCVGW
ncbi:hypothetical protein GCM10010261_22840 [Streptomyces pilosus]|uniref:Uncharacterized protein n=1 Tax=Streptomyces pilosus TaxID=28893 RepID=A0A918F0L7_9ACTN|nr:hypothetical protein GCM10010280_46900 [Streptomyces pilosus]GGV47084.1 hypothetical protein GCM10010261_22840 [Streptomyces pilosus]